MIKTIGLYYFPKIMTYMKEEAKDMGKRIWNFIWHEDSAWSWIANIILAFVIIKFIFYPVLGLLVGTGFPIVAVVSGSMEHDGSFDAWWNSDAICGEIKCTQEEYYAGYGLTKGDFLDYRFMNGFNKGDIMVLLGLSPEKIKKGDVVVFMTNRPDPIIHRVIKIGLNEWGYNFQTKGDHNLESININGFSEIGISEKQILGKAVFRVPYLGWIKVWFADYIANPYCTITNNFFPCRG